MVRFASAAGSSYPFASTGSQPSLVPLPAAYRCAAFQATLHPGRERPRQPPISFAALHLD